MIKPQITTLSSTAKRNNDWSPDRRKINRILIDSQVHLSYQGDDGPRIVLAKGKDFAEGCMTLEAKELPPEKTRAQVSIIFGGEHLENIPSRIVWKSNGAEWAYCGITFEVPLEECGTYQRMLEYVKTNGVNVERRKNNRRVDTTANISDYRMSDRRSRLKFYSKAHRWSKRLQAVKRSGVYPYLKEIEGALDAGHAKINGQDSIMMASNNYLGLANDPRVIEATINAVRQYGVGLGGARLLSGTSRLHKQLEESLAKFKGTEAAILYSSGFLANYGFFSTLLEKGDAVFIDQRVHASIVDGCMHSGAEIRTFRHNNANDLERKLRMYGKFLRKMVVVDGVYSMEGDIADLPAIHRISEKYGAMLIVDDAHATGVIGKTGHGTEEYFDMKFKADVTVGTLSKSLGSTGGFVCGSREMVDYLQHFSRAFVFNASLPPAMCAASLASLSILEQEPHRVKNLANNAAYLRQNLSAMGYKILDGQTPIIPLIIGKESIMDQINKFLFENGIIVSPVGRPALKRTEARLRINVMATHTKGDLDKALDLFRKAYKKFGPFETSS